MQLLEYTVVFALGSVIGSFLNVVIHRVPAGMSIIRPPSHCPHCKRPVKPHENIPIISYLLLRGRCAGCRKPISIQYPIIEALTGLFAVILLLRFGWTWQNLIYFVLAALLIALSAIDFKTFRLPNTITLSGAVLAVALTLAFRRNFILSMLLGGVIGFGLLWFMWLIGRLLFRRESLGMGDIKLAAMMGLFLGPGRTAGMFILGVFVGALVGGGLILLGNRNWGQKIPFGPYLAVGAVISLIWGDALWKWYMFTFLR